MGLLVIAWCGGQGVLLQCAWRQLVFWGFDVIARVIDGWWVAEGHLLVFAAVRNPEQPQPEDVGSASLRKLLDQRRCASILGEGLTGGARVFFRIDFLWILGESPLPGKMLQWGYLYEKSPDFIFVPMGVRDRTVAFVNVRQLSDLQRSIWEVTLQLFCGSQISLTLSNCTSHFRLGSLSFNWWHQSNLSLCQFSDTHDSKWFSYPI